MFVYISKKCQHTYIHKYKQAYIHAHTFMNAYIILYIHMQNKTKKKNEISFRIFTCCLLASQDISCISESERTLCFRVSVASNLSVSLTPSSLPVKTK